MKHLRTSILALMIVAVGCNSPKKETKLVDKIKLKDLQGNPIDLNDYQGKALFINVWATWCKPCIQEMPSIASAQKTLNGKPIEFFFASDEGKERIELFEAKQKLGLRYVQLENMDALEILALPQTYILNNKGDVVFSEAGFRQWDDEANIELLNRIIETNEE